MATTSCISGSGLRQPAELLREIKIRLQLTESESHQLLVRFRSLPADHPRKFALLRQLEIAAAVAGELQDIEALILGRSDIPAHTAESPANRPGNRPARRGRPRE